MTPEPEKVILCVTDGKKQMSWGFTDAQIKALRPKALGAHVLRMVDLVLDSSASGKKAVKA